jgi:hypothetical protein
LNPTHYHTVVSIPQTLLSKRVADSKVVQVRNRVNECQQENHLQETPIFESFDHIVKGRFLCVVPFLLLFDNSLNFRNVFLASVPFSNSVKNLFRMFDFIVVHQNVWRLFKKEEKHDKKSQEGNQLKNDDEIKPVQFQQIKHPQ